MIPIVCAFSFLFGNWSLKWIKRNGRYEFNYYFVFTVMFVFINCFYFFQMIFKDLIQNNIIKTNPQRLIVCTIYFICCVLVTNRLMNAKHSVYFANEMMKDCGRTVESGRHLPEFWFRTCCVCLLVHIFYYKQRLFTEVPLVVAVLKSISFTCAMTTMSTMESQYTSACNALADEFASLNEQTRAAAGTDAKTLVAVSRAHCRLVRLTRLFNDEYSVPILLTTVHLLLSQLFSMNDFVAMTIVRESFEPFYVYFEQMLDCFLWTWQWFRFWWICHSVDCLTEQIDLTAKIMLEKDISSFPGNTRQLALDFLDQLLHRHIRITAWGFYDINKELLFMIIGYQIGLCLICTQFTTSGAQIINRLTTRRNYTSAEVS